MLGFGSSLHRETVTVATWASGDADADGVPAKVPGPDLVLESCNVQAQTTTQVIDGGVQTITSYRVSAPGIGHGVRRGAKVTWRLPGTWFVEGTGLEFAATGLLDHTEFTITNVEG